MTLATSIPLSAQAVPLVRAVETEQEAAKVAAIYIPYFQRMKLDQATFLARWRNAHADKNYHMLAAYGDAGEVLGFMDFSLVPSIFWGPCLARIDSVHIPDEQRETEVFDALFEHAQAIMKQHAVSKVIAVSCAKYEQEVRLLTSKLAVDDNPTKTFLELKNP